MYDAVSVSTRIGKSHFRKELAVAEKSRIRLNSGAINTGAGLNDLITEPVCYGIVK